MTALDRPAAGHQPRDALGGHALAAIPRILTLQDRNPASPTFGCFDRNYWQYRMIDFPSGMAQEFVWPLALAWSLPLPRNPWHQAPAVRDWIEAGIRFAARSAHPDGSCDDYYPWERATGAAAFSLLACVEAADIIGLDDAETRGFLARRAGWLASHRESGRLANHEALVVLGLLRLSETTGEPRWRQAAGPRLQRLLSWQSPEGWFAEYEGCDPGYLTLTVSLLARIAKMAPGAGLDAALDRAARFAAQFSHPDGTYGGEYGSRNTLNFFPHGFELTGRANPDLLAVNDRFLQALHEGRAPCHDDDHILGHHAWNVLLAWRDWVPQRPAPTPHPEGRHWFPQAGLLIDRRGGTELYAAPGKGCVFKLFRDGRLVWSDTQVSLRLAERTAVAHMMGGSTVEIEDDAVKASGEMCWAKAALMTPARMVALRLLMMTLGRLSPNLVRRLLQRLLIVGRRPAPFTFTRRLCWRDGGWVVEDAIRGGPWSAVTAAGIGGHQTSIHVVMSRVWAAEQMQPWVDLTPEAARLDDGAVLRLERRL
ncbi:MAG: hypothetical protein HQL41_00475 [Alphaproteobacteria bacterium]|nr:hypothetical protein [Alphaproteobacteria bacterium]